MNYIRDTLETLRFTKLEYPDSEFAKGISKVGNPGQAALVYFNSFRESLIGLARMDFARLVHHIKEMQLNGQLVATALDPPFDSKDNKIGPDRLIGICRQIDYCVGAVQRAEETAVKQLTERVLEIRELADFAHRCTNDCKHRLLDGELSDALARALEPTAETTKFGIPTPQE